MKKVVNLVKTNEFILVLLLVAIIFVFGSLNHKFLIPKNIVQYLNSSVILGLLTFGLAATIITANFDFSIGAMCGFGTVAIAQLITWGFPLAVALLVTLILLVGFGALNGYIVGYLRIPGMLATLGTSSIYYGIALVFTGGQAISVMNSSSEEAYRFFGKSDIGKIPFGMVLLAVVFIISYLLLHHTRFGRRLFLIGENPEAAKFSGIDQKRDIFLAHIFSAVMCFLGAVILGSKMASGRADVGSPFVLEAVSAAVFGGISIKGGKGSLIGALLGVLIFALLTSGFTMIGLSQYYRQVTTGLLLIIVLLSRNFRVIFNKS